jgi:apolipoprotein N-acyltransferase
MRLKQVEGEFFSWRSFRVGIAQGSIEQSLKWDEAYQGRTMEIYRGLTKKAADLGAHLVIWPESAAPFFISGDGPDAAVVGTIAKESRTFVLTGIDTYARNPLSRTTDFFNSAVLFSPSGEMTAKYDKTHLVPFGEYVPLKRFLPFIKKLTAGVGDFKEGPGPVPLKFISDGIGMLICYEAIFPEIARGAVKNGAAVLVNITNDAWFGKSSAPYQHFDMSALRAVENRVFLLRSANTGISGVVDPTGRVRKKLGLFERDVINAVAGMRSGAPTIYTIYGDVFAYWCLAVSGALAVALIFKRRS